MNSITSWYPMRLDLDSDEADQFINFHKLVDLTYKVTAEEFWEVISKFSDREKHNIQVNLRLSTPDFVSIFHHRVYRDHLDKREIVDRFYDVIYEEWKNEQKITGSSK